MKTIAVLAMHGSPPRDFPKAQVTLAYKLNPDGKTSPYRIPESDVIAFEKKRHQDK